MRRGQPFRHLSFQHKTVAHQQVHEIVFAKTVMADTYPNFPFSRLETVAGAADGNFTFIEIFVQQPSELRLNLEHNPHHQPVQSMKLLLIVNLDFGAHFNRHGKDYVL